MGTIGRKSCGRLVSAQNSTELLLVASKSRVSRRLEALSSSTRSHFRWESPGKVLEFLQLRANLYLCLLVQEDGEESLRPTSILNGLSGEEEVLSSVEIEIAISWSVAGLLPGGILEEEDHPIDRATQGQHNAYVILRPLILSPRPLLFQQICIKGDELFKLYVLNTKVVNQEGKNPLMRSARLSFADPLVKLTASDSIVFHPADIFKKKTTRAKEFENCDAPNKRICSDYLALSHAGVSSFMVLILL